MATSSNSTTLGRAGLPFAGRRIWSTLIKCISFAKSALLLVFLLIARESPCSGQQSANSFSPTAESTSDIDSKVKKLVDSGEKESAVALVQGHPNELRDAYSLALLAWSLIESDPEAAKIYTARSIDVDSSSIAVVEQALYLAKVTNDTNYAAQVLRSFYLKNPHMKGSYAASSGFDMNADDLAHGKEQIELALADRPALKTLLIVDSALYDWIVRRLAGEFSGSRIYWLPEEPDVVVPGIMACHNVARDMSSAKIWVSAELEPDYMLAALVFEILNVEVFIEAIHDKNKVNRSVSSGESKVREVVLTEHKTTLRIKAFFTSQVLSGALSNDLSLDPWLFSTSLDPEKFFEQMSQRPIYIDYIRKQYGK